jgi:hypothetical protein
LNVSQGSRVKAKHWHIGALESPIRKALAETGCEEKAIVKKK